MPGLLAGVKLPSVAISPERSSGSSSDSGSDSEPVFSGRNGGTGRKNRAAAAATADGGSNDLLAWMAAEAARLSSPEPPRSLPQVSKLRSKQRATSLPPLKPKPDPEPEPEPESATSGWLTAESRPMEAERSTQKRPESSAAAKELAQAMSNAAMVEATHQQESEDKSHLPAWLRSSGVKIAAHRLHVNSTVKNVNKLQVEVDRLKASHMLFTKTDWPAGTLWNPNGERQERPPPPCPMDLLPDEVLMGVLTSVRRAKTLLNLSQCCTRLRRLADEEPYLWRRLCAQEWGLPTHAISTKELSWSTTLMSADGVAPRPWSPMSNQWKVTWLDLSRAWAHQADTFKWLHDHGHPSDVSGKRHRLAIWQAVMYLAKFTERPMSRLRQQLVIKQHTIAAIAALLSNDMNLDLQERACAALANILSNCSLDASGVIHLDDEELAEEEQAARKARWIESQKPSLSAEAAPMRPNEFVQGLTVALISDPTQTGSVVKRDGKQVRVDFGTHKLTLDYREIEPVEAVHKVDGRLGTGSRATAGDSSHPRTYYDDASRAAQEAADAALARRLAMLPPGEEMSPSALQEEEDVALALQLAAASASSSPSAMSATRGYQDTYQADWGERPDPHLHSSPDFDAVGETSWGLHGAVPLIRAVGRVINEMHRPVEVYKEASRALLNLMVANAEAEGRIERSEAEFTNYHEYLDQPIGEDDGSGKSPKLERIFSPKEETKAGKSQLVALAAPGAGSLVLATVQSATAAGAEGYEDTHDHEQEQQHNAEHDRDQQSPVSAADSLHFELNGWWHGEVYYTSGNMQTTRTFCLRPKERDDATGGSEPERPSESGLLAAIVNEVDDPELLAQLLRCSESRAAEDTQTEVELEGEGWDDTGPFRVTGGLRYDGVSGERYWLLDCTYIAGPQAAGDYRRNASSVVRLTLFVSPAHVASGGARTEACKPSVVWGVWEQYTGSTIMTSERRSRGVFRFTARDEREALSLGAQQHNIFGA